MRPPGITVTSSSAIPSVMVFGAGGRLGAVVARRLAALRTCRVVPVYGTNGGPAGELKVDVRDAVKVEALVASVRPKRIVHLAAIVGARCEVDPGRAEEVNVGGSAAIARAAQLAGVERIVHSSTSAVYGDGYSAPVGETAAPLGTGHYARTKLAGERILAEAADEGLAVVAMRIFNIFGPGFDDSLIARLESAEPDAPADLRGLDRFVRDYCRVDDVAESLVRVLTVPLREPRTVLNVGSGVATSNRRLVDLLSETQRVNYRVGPDLQSYSCADVTTAVSLLGYTPRDLRISLRSNS